MSNSVDQGRDSPVTPAAGLPSSPSYSSRPNTPQHKGRVSCMSSFYFNVDDPAEPKSLNLKGSRGRPSSAASSPGVAETPIERQDSGRTEAKPWGSRSSHTRLFIKGGKLVNCDGISEGDLYVEDGIIKQLGKDLTVPGGTKTIDARGKLVIPGGIDANVHLQLPFMGCKTADDFYQGTKAALAGGTTMIIACALDQGSLLESYEKWRSWADEKVCCDYGLSVAITSWSQAVHNEMEQLAKEKGINSFDVFMAYKGLYMLRDDALIEVMKASKSLGSLVRVHAENGDIITENEKKLLAMGTTGPEAILYSRSDEVEAEAAHRAIVLGNQMNCPIYIQRMTGKGAANILSQKRKEGCIAFGETLAACLATDGSHYFNKCWNHAAGHITCPPLRADPDTREHIIAALGNGDLQVVSSDHRPFTNSQKSQGQNDFTQIPHGIGGVEERMCVTWQNGVVSGKMDPCRFVAVTSSNAAKYFNIYPRKGCIQIGSDADIVIWNPNQHRTFSLKLQQSQGDFNIYEGMECQGSPEFVISQGRVVLEDGQVHVSQGVGHFVPTPAFSPYLYNPVQEREGGKKAPDDIALDGLQNGEETIKARNMHLPLGSSPTGQTQEFHNRPPTRSGGRNLQDSSFSLSGAQFDDNKSPRSGIRVHNPPGGRSSGLW